MRIRAGRRGPARRRTVVHPQTLVRRWRHAIRRMMQRVRTDRDWTAGPGGNLVGRSRARDLPAVSAMLHPPSVELSPARR